MAEEFWEGTKKGVVMMKVTKEEKDLFEIVRKIKPEQWKALHGFMEESKDILAQGGITTFFKSELMAIKDDLVSMLVDPLVAPLLEAFAPSIASLAEDIIPTLQDTITTLGNAISTILGVDLPGGQTIGSVLISILNMCFKFIGIIPLIANIEELARYIMKKLGDIFGFKTEGGDTDPWGIEGWPTYGPYEFE